MTRTIASLLLASMIGSTGCNGQLPPSEKSIAVGVRDVAGGTQTGDPRPENFRQGFALREVEPLAIDRKLFGAITRFDPNEGLAVLADGRCLQFRQGRSVSGRSTDAIILAGDTRCKGLAPAGEGRVSLPCHGQLSELVGDWRLRCSVLKNGRSTLVAVGARSTNANLQLTLATLDDEVRAVHVFVVHSPHAVVTMLGWRDGKATLSWYDWNASSTQSTPSG